MNLPAENLLALPRDLDLVQGTLFEPLAVVLHAMKFTQLQPLETAAVFGAGPIGLLTIAILKMSGAGRIWAIEPIAYRREMAIRAGADAAIDPRAVHTAGEVLRDTAGRGADVTIDCAARQNSMNECVETTRNGGRLIIVGIPHKLETPFNWHLARRRELTIYNVRRSNRESEKALQVLSEEPGRFRFLFTHTLPLEEVQSAFDMLRYHSDGAGKVVIAFQ